LKVGAFGVDSASSGSTEHRVAHREFGVAMQETGLIPRCKRVWRECGAGPLGVEQGGTVEAPHEGSRPSFGNSFEPIFSVGLPHNHGDEIGGVLVTKACNTGPVGERIAPLTLVLAQEVRGIRAVPAEVKEM